MVGAISIHQPFDEPTVDIAPQNIRETAAHP
jgi:hypothetical protein